MSASLSEMEESSANLPPVSGWGSHTQMLRALDQKHAGREILRAVREMPETWQQVFLLVVVEELTYEEVATALGCAVGTVASRLHRARRHLLKTLAALARDEGFSTEEGR